MNKFISKIKDISLPNKYTKWYINIIKKSFTIEKFSYTEKHHIVPKSFAKKFDINNIHDPQNLANLTAREHYICHRLLTKMFTGKIKQKMTYAIHRLTYSDNGKKGETYATSRHYEQIRKQHSENLKGEGNPMFGKTHSDDTKTKMSVKAKNRIVSNATKIKMSASKIGENNYMFGKTHSVAARKKISAANKGIGTGENNNFYGKTHSVEVKQKLSEARKNQPKTECPHCSKMVDPSNFKRWHGDNCKLLSVR